MIAEKWQDIDEHGNVIGESIRLRRRTPDEMIITLQAQVAALLLTVERMSNDLTVIKRQLGIREE